MFGLEKMSDKGAKITKGVLVGGSVLLTGLSAIFGIEEHRREQAAVEERAASEARDMVRKIFEEKQKDNNA